MGFVADTHVHIYPQYDIARALTGASQQLTSIAAQLHLSPSSLTKILCLTERNTESYFMRFQSGRETAFAVHPTSEACSVLVEITPAERLAVIAGRQIVTREKLEVTVLGCLDAPPVGFSLDEVISWAVSRGGIPVLNWSLGKWLGARGERLTQFLETESRHRFLMGDILMRAKWTPKPKAMRLASKLGIPTIAGSDPLPMAGEEDLIGRYVTWGPAEVSHERPWRDLSLQLLDTEPKLGFGGERGTLRDLLERSLRYRLSKG